MTKKPRVLFFDVETRPVLAWIWQIGSKIRIGHEQIRKGDKFDIICICWKWQGEKEIHSLDWGLHKQDSSSMLAEFTKVIESADIVIGHNADRFDVKQINTQRLLHGQDPIMWPTSEDTLKQFKKHFAFPCYKLDYLAKVLTGEGKGSMCFQDWIDVVENKSAKALAKMLKYCKRDVLKLEQIFSRAFRYFTPKASMSIITRNDRDGCPRCGSAHVNVNGHRITQAGRYPMFQCKSCGHYFKGRTRSNDTP
jgi:hypothetical protein